MLTRWPLGGKREWRGSADFRAAYEASLRLALARMEREHRPEHSLITLLQLDRGCAWLLSQVGVDRNRLAYAVKLRFPPPHRNVIIRAAERNVESALPGDRPALREHLRGAGAEGGLEAGLLRG